MSASEGNEMSTVFAAVIRAVALGGAVSYVLASWHLVALLASLGG